MIPYHQPVVNYAPGDATADGPKLKWDVVFFTVGFLLLI